MGVSAVAVLGGVLLDAVESDNPTHAFDVTDKAVEGGASIADHMSEKPPMLSISGVVVGTDAAARLSRIRQLQSNRQLITYVNRVVYSNLAITNISTEHAGNISNGFRFDVTLKVVRRASKQTAQVNAPAPVATKASPPQNAGTQQIRPTNKQSNNKAADARLANISSGFGGGSSGLMTVEVM